MSASELNQQMIDWLGAGDQVHPQECVKKLARELADLITQPVDRPTTEEQLDELLARFDEPCERFLAAVFPLIEYADEHALRVVGRCLLHVAEQTAAGSEERRGWDARLGVVALGRLIWSITTFAIHCGRWSTIAELGRVSIAVPYREREVVTLLALRQLRYPEALGGNAGNAYADYSQWLSRLELLSTQYPLLGAQANVLFGEADLLLALTAAAGGGRVYSESADASTVRRFARDAADSRNRAALADLFQSTDEALNNLMEQAYASLETNQNRWDRPPTALFSGAVD